jgi:hypothetical protein
MLTGAVLLLGGGAVSAQAFPSGYFTTTVEQYYGQVTYVKSDLEITDTTLKGPGTNVNRAGVTVENTGSEDTTFDLEVTLTLNDGSTDTVSSTENESAGESTTYNVSFSGKYKEYNVDKVESVLTEQ